MVWNPKCESMTVGDRQELQCQYLREVVNRVWERVPSYRQKMEKVGLKPDDITSLDDLWKLPFTLKEDMRANYPFGLFATPLRQTVRLHTSSGTTGRPTVVGYTRNDIEVWAEVMARTLACGGATEDSIIHNAYGYGLFTGGLGIHYGAERLGATVIPVSAGQSKRQCMLLTDMGADIITCTPSFALYLAEVAEEMGLNPAKDFKLKAGLLGAEPWSEQMRKEIEEKMNMRALDIYGLSEIIGPGVSSECWEQNGLHIFDDHFLPEIIDPETGEPLTLGKTGELVITTLTKEAFPVIRYRTRDITSLSQEECPCGRTHVKMQKVRGRTDDMLIIRGINVFPSQIESVLLEIEETAPHYQIIIRRTGTLDDLEIKVEINEQVFSDEVKKLEALERKVAQEIETTIGLKAKITLVEPRSLQRFEGKARRVIDERQL